MVLLWSGLATGDARLPAAALAPDARRSRRPRRGSPTCAGTTTSAGRSATPTRRPSAVERLRPPALPQRLLRGPVPGLVRPRRAVPGERGHRRRPRSPARAASLCGIEEALERGDDAALEAGHPPAGAALLGRLLLRRHPAAVHGRRAGAAQRHRLPRRPRAGAGQPLDAPPADGLGGGRAAHRPGDARGPGVRLAAAAGGGPPGAARRCAAAASARSWTSATTPCWPGGAGTRAAARSSGWPTSAAPPQTGRRRHGDRLRHLRRRCWPATGRPSCGPTGVLLPGPRLRLVRRALTGRGGCDWCGTRQALPSARG